VFVEATFFLEIQQNSRFLTKKKKLYRGSKPMKRTVEDGRGRRNYESTRLPKVSHGACKNYKRCKNYNVVLGDRLCELCWDGRAGK